jgi:hypothetical protein
MAYMLRDMPDHVCHVSEYVCVLFFPDGLPIILLFKNPTFLQKMYVKLSVAVAAAQNVLVFSLKM